MTPMTTYTSPVGNRMDARFIAVVVLAVLTGCSTASRKNAPIPDMTVNMDSNGRQVLAAIPAESAMERFEMIDPQGRIISYVALTDTDTGALVFVNQKLYGTLSHHDAQAFYSCRGYVTNASSHWAHEAADWGASLLADSKPATEVKLKFSGKSTTQSIKEVAESPLLKKLKSIFSIGSNPLGIFNSLNTARSDMEESGQFDKVKNGLSSITPGMSESKVAEVMKPEDVSFIGGGMAMIYPAHLVEYYVADGVVKVIQQPSFNFLFRTHAAVFYEPGALWEFCTPLRWKEAVPGKH